MTEITHWADVLAGEALSRNTKNIISTGITPSGHIHIGNMREVMTADAVYRAVCDKGGDAVLYYIADTFDPLRKVYPFLKEEEFAHHVGKPLSEIPCPCGHHSSYSEHFLDPFLSSLEKLGIRPAVLKTEDLYKAGKFVPAIIKSLENRDRIAAILHDVSGKEAARDWSPFNPICGKCGRINSAKVTGFSAEHETVDYICACGHAGTASMTGGGKLTWRVEWPAKWALLGVTVEPFGKDHGAAGGSYETGVRIVREIFGAEPPIPINYEWIMLGDQGAMSSSAGVVVSIADMLEVVPPESLRYLIMKTKPEKHIRFDPGQPLLNLVDEYERLRDKADADAHEKRVVALSKAEGVSQSRIPFKQMVTIWQVARGDQKRIGTIAKRAGFDEDPAVISQMAANVSAWLDKYAPPFAKFGVSDTVPVQAASLTDVQRAFLQAMADALDASGDLSAEDVQRLVYETKETGTPIAAGMEAHMGAPVPPDRIDPKQFFSAIYISLLGQPSGPKAGWFLTSFDSAFLSERFREAASYRP